MSHSQKIDKDIEKVFQEEQKERFDSLRESFENQIYILKDIAEKLTKKEIEIIAWNCAFTSIGGVAGGSSGTQ